MGHGMAPCHDVVVTFQLACQANSEKRTKLNRKISRQLNTGQTGHSSGGDGHPVTRHRCDAHRQCLGKYLQNSIGIVKLKYTRYPYFGDAWIATQDARAITRQFGREVGQTHFVRIQDPTNPLARTLWDRLDSTKSVAHTTELQSPMRS